MGLFSREKGAYWNIPDEKLDWNQRARKKYESPEMFNVDSGKGYTRNHREEIDGCMHQSLGLRDFDDFLQMKAPRFYNIYTQGIKNLNNLCDYVGDNLPKYKDFQELKEEINQLKKQNEEQKTMIEKYMAQNEKLQHQILEKINAQSQTQSSSFSR